MEGWHIAIILKPLGLLVLLVALRLLVWPLRKYMPDGRLKRFLFISWKV